MLKKIGIIILSACMAMVFFGCELFAPKAQKGEKNVTVIIDLSGYDGDIAVNEGFEDYNDDKIKEFTVKTQAERLETLLDELLENKKITYGGIKSMYGLEIKNIDNVILEGNKFYAIYTDDEENSNTDFSLYEYGDKSIGSASWGATSLPVKDGCIYVIAISEF